MSHGDIYITLTIAFFSSPLEPSTECEGQIGESPNFMSFCRRPCSSSSSPAPCLAAENVSCAPIPFVHPVHQQIHDP